MVSNRSIAVILLFLTFTAPVVLTYAILHYQKKQVKRSVKWSMIDGLNKCELVLLSFSKVQSTKELSWEHSHEFEYRGEMYDVVETDTLEDSIHYWCWCDHAETNLNRQLKELLASVWEKNTQQKDKQETLFSFYKQLFKESPDTLLLTLHMARAKSIYLFRDPKSREHYSPPTPPPRLSNMI